MIEQQQAQQQFEEESMLVQELLSQAEDLEGFEIDDDIKNTVYENLTTFGENGSVRFVEEYMEKPEGLIAAATAVYMMPKIAEYVSSLHDRIAQLESNVKQIPEFKTPNNMPKKNVVDDNYVW